jgi:hypothetical protein
MAAHVLALDWGVSLNQRRRGGKLNTIMMMFVGGVVLIIDGTFRTTPTVEDIQSGSFSFPPESFLLPPKPK